MMLATIMYLFLMILALGISIAEHGKPKTGKTNFFTTLAMFIFQIVLLYHAGFFDKFFN